MEIEEISFYILFLALIAGAYFLGKNVCLNEANKKIEEVETALSKLRDK